MTWHCHGKPILMWNNKSLLGVTSGIIETLSTPKTYKPAVKCHQHLQKLHLLSSRVSGRRMLASPLKRSGSCFASPCESYTFPHHLMLVSKKVRLWAATFMPTTSKRSSILSSVSSKSSSYPQYTTTVNLDHAVQALKYLSEWPGKTMSC